MNGSMPFSLNHGHSLKTEIGVEDSQKKIDMET
jgi:hypothetical protein